MVQASHQFQGAFLNQRFWCPAESIIRSSLSGRKSGFRKDILNSLETLFLSSVLVQLLSLNPFPVPFLSKPVLSQPNGRSVYKGLNPISLNGLLLYSSPRELFCCYSHFLRRGNSKSCWLTLFLNSYPSHLHERGQCHHVVHPYMN